MSQQEFDFSVVPSMDQSLAELEDRPEDRSVQSQFALGLYSISDLNRLLSMIAEGVLAMTGLERAYVVLKDRKLYQVHVDRAKLGEPFSPDEFLFSQIIVDHVMDKREAYYCEHADLARPRYDAIPDPRVKTILSFPLLTWRHPVAGESMDIQLVGAVYAESKNQAVSCSEEKMGMLSLLAGHCAMAIENSRVYQMATFDKLTSVYLRHFVIHQLRTEWRRSRRHLHALSVAMVDVDHFKQINDTYGHTYGDRVLQKVTQSLKRMIRAEDVLGRYGGEEFLLVLPHTDAEGAEIIANRLRESVRATRFGGLDQPVTVSIGLASFPDHETNESDQLIRKADVALYQAKSAGRDRVCTYQQNTT